MSYLIFISCFITAGVIGFRWGVYREHLRQNRGRVAVLRIAQKYADALSERSNN